MITVDGSAIMNSSRSNMGLTYGCHGDELSDTPRNDEGPDTLSSSDPFRRDDRI